MGYWQTIPEINAQKKRERLDKQIPNGKKCNAAPAKGHLKRPPTPESDLGKKKKGSPRKKQKRKKRIGPSAENE